MDLNEIRQKIDQLDCQIVQLLKNRMESARIAMTFKETTFDEQREKQILEVLSQCESALLRSDFIKDVYSLILKESKNIQESIGPVIAFQGEHGAYSESACMVWDPKLAPMPCHEFADVFSGVEQGVYDYGIVPVENTLGGMVGAVNGQLIKSDLHIVGAVKMAINHCLLAVPGTDYRAIRRVYSHPQALTQCREYLKRHNLEPVAHYDTAGAARILAEERPAATAAIASKLSSRFYNLSIIQEQIEDLDTNQTRFVVISRDANKNHGSKCSIVFATPDKAGALFGVLELFAKKNINLTRIDSMPDAPGEFAFFLDFEGSIDDPEVAGILEQVEQSCHHYRFLGCYDEKVAL
ncbi:P-protein [Limihaloglobus sulfuriphilus]|uniref:Bifunctional chorismate mutase/prephenate dehydratase n=1 Tax=Limihaloglobus sulfuriphilus TaxID=1851148 RepID=A0A1Q2MDP5_9BACT|nr:prephenate dehydratase [Limihaloglobus sulfuriphilus]AQQ70764.1 P-protein [Limihaloglobus sulfuriphilus]